MPGLFGSLYSAGTGLNVNQLSIQTTSHNINNMNTEGYTRQKVERSASSAYSYPGLNSSLGAGQLGTGVEATSIVRMRNVLYDYQYRTEATDYGNVRIQYDYYSSMENIFSEPSSTQISSSLDDFFDEWNELTKDPNSVGAKSSAISKIKYLVSNINRAYSKLDDLKDNLQKQQTNIINDINTNFDRLAELDKDITIIQASGKTPNDLLDERDKILDDISQKLDLYSNGSVKDKDGNPVLGEAQNIQSLIDGFKTEVNGNVTIEYDKLQLQIDNSGSIVITATKDGNTVKSVDLGQNVSGELGATIGMDKEISNYKSYLEKFASGITDAVNSIYNTDLTATDKNLFYTQSLNGIATLGNNEIIALRDDINIDATKLELTSDMALELYSLKNTKVTFEDFNGNNTDISISNYYSNIIQNLGQSSAAAIKAESNQGKLLNTIENSRANESSVSLDEEMVDLIQFQHGYSASAKVISTIDELLDVVINGLVR